jgi:regulatory protein spx
MEACFHRLASFATQFYLAPDILLYDFGASFARNANELSSGIQFNRVELRTEGVGTMGNAKIKFLQKPSCTTCRKAKAFLEKRKVQLDLRDLGKDRLSVDELDKLIGKRDHRMFLNTRNQLYRARKMGENPPSREETLQLMAAEPNLIRRPVALRGADMVLGYDEEALKRIAK